MIGCVIFLFSFRFLISHFLRPTFPHCIGGLDGTTEYDPDVLGYNRPTCRITIDEYPGTPLAQSNLDSWQNGSFADDHDRGWGRCTVPFET
jgi:hypothetical protein